VISDAYKAQMVERERARVAALRSAHCTPPPPVVESSAGKARKDGGKRSSAPAEAPGALVAPPDAPVQPELFADDDETLRFRAECQATGKRGKHFGGRHG